MNWNGLDKNNKSGWEKWTYRRYRENINDIKINKNYNNEDQRIGINEHWNRQKCEKQSLFYKLTYK